MLLRLSAYFTMYVWVALLDAGRSFRFRTCCPIFREQLFGHPRSGAIFTEQSAINLVPQHANHLARPDLFVQRRAPATLLIRLGPECFLRHRPFANLAQSKKQRSGDKKRQPRMPCFPLDTSTVSRLTAVSPSRRWDRVYSRSVLHVMGRMKIPYEPLPKAKMSTRIM